MPDYPTLFPKFADSLIGAHDDIVKPAETDALDWEVEFGSSSATRYAEQTTRRQRPRSPASP